MVTLPITAWMHDSRDVELSLIVDTSNCTWRWQQSGSSDDPSM